MNVLEADYYEYQDANGLRLENALIHEYVQFHLKKISTFQTRCRSSFGWNIEIYAKLCFLPRKVFFFHLKLTYA